VSVRHKCPTSPYAWCQRDCFSTCYLDGHRLAVMTPATVRRVPNAPKTPMHSFRCPDELWEAAKAKAAEKDETLTDVLRKALERYVKRA